MSYKCCRMLYGLLKSFVASGGDYKRLKNTQMIKIYDTQMIFYQKTI